MALIDRINGLVGNTGMKAPCDFATTAAIALSGEQTIDGSLRVAGTRGLVKDQADAATNGVYAVSSGAWVREPDMDGAYDVSQGTTVLVNSGTQNAGTYWRISAANPIGIGTTLMTWVRALISDSTLLNFTPSGTGAVARSVQDKLREHYITPEDFGAVADGVTNCYAAFVLMAAAAGDYTEMRLGRGNYLIAYAGAGYDVTKPHGDVLMHFSGLKNISIRGDHSKITIANHDITANGGFRVIQITSCRHVDISGVEFDLSYTGFNNSASYYPFCGAIFCDNTDNAAWTQPQSALWNDIRIDKCIFTIFHPLGQFRITSNPHLGDPNNGYKCIGIFLQGLSGAQTRTYQNRIATVENCLWTTGCNTYLCWFWGVDGAVFRSNVYDGVCAYCTDAAGVKQNPVPLLRYHQFYTKSFLVVNNQFLGRLRDDRTGYYDGQASFIGLMSNDYSQSSGSTKVISNHFALSSSVTTAFSGDSGIYLGGVCGDVLVDGNSFSSSETTFANAIPMRGITAGGSDTVDSASYLTVINNVFDRSCQVVQSCHIQQGAATAAKRWMKSLIFSGNQISGFLSNALVITTSGLAVCQVEKALITGNLIAGDKNVLTPPSDSDNRAIYIDASGDANDEYVVTNNRISGAQYGIYQTFAPVGIHRVAGNQFTNCLAYKSIVWNHTIAPFYAAPTYATPGTGVAATLPAGAGNTYFYTLLGVTAATGVVEIYTSTTAVGGTVVGAAVAGRAYSLMSYIVKEQS